jgi:hypothetical protein
MESIYQCLMWTKVHCTLNVRMLGLLMSDICNSDLLNNTRNEDFTIGKTERVCMDTYSLMASVASVACPSVCSHVSRRNATCQ